MTKLKNVVNKTLVIISAIIIAYVLGITLFTYLDRYFDYTVEIVTSGSMEPEINVGSIIVVHKDDCYREGEIISFKGHSLSNDYVTHRITKIEENEDGEKVFYTKGDANQIADSGTVAEDEIVGELWFKLPMLGKLYTFTKTPLGALIVVGIPSLIILREEIAQAIAFLLKKLNISITLGNKQNKEETKEKPEKQEEPEPKKKKAKSSKKLNNKVKK